MATPIPKVSIGLPVYNGEKYLASALECLLAQDYADFELIISDNASTDSTEEICWRYAARDQRIRYHRNEANIGASRNYTRVFELARGEFFKWSSHDDACDPSLVRRCLEKFAQSPTTTVLVFTQSEIIDEFGKVTELSPDRVASSSSHPFVRLAKVLWTSSSAHSLWGVIRSDALRRTRLYGCIEADHVLLAELALLGHLVEIPEPLHQLRMHPRNASQINRTARQMLAWHDPKRATDRMFLPEQESVYWEYIKGVSHSSLPLASRLLCYATVPPVCYWRRFLRATGPLRTRLGLRRKPARAVG